MLFPSSWECRPGPMISEMQSQFLWSQKYSPSSVVLKCCPSFLILEMQFQILSVPIICSVMWDPQVQELGLQFWDWISEITMFLSYLTDIPSLQLGAISMICPLDFTCILNDFRWQGFVTSAGHHLKVPLVTLVWQKTMFVLWWRHSCVMCMT